MCEFFACPTCVPVACGGASPRTEIAGSCEPPCGWWESNLGSLEEQSVQAWQSSLVCRASSRIAKATQRKPVSINKTKTWAWCCMSLIRQGSREAGVWELFRVTFGCVSSLWPCATLSGGSKGGLENDNLLSHVFSYRCHLSDDCGSLKLI